MAHERDQLIGRLRAAQRVHVIGGSGAGKSVLADRLGAVLRLPVHHLDEVALDGSSGGHRPTEDCRSAVREISVGERWLSEGIYVGWTADLLRSADVIVWLDTVSGRTAKARIIRRFISSAVATAGQRRGMERFARFRDYARHSRALLRALADTGRYHRGSMTPGDRHGLAKPSRAATEAVLRPYRAKTLHVGREDVAGLIEALRQ